MLSCIITDKNNEQLKERILLDTDRYMTMVDTNNLSSPIMLLNDYFNNKSTWTTKPTAFVGTSLDKIFRWDLENRDYPKGYASFHDYIVQEDLKKLTREKRQWLGQ